MNMPRQRVYLLAAISSLLLYAVGVFTGAMILGYTESKSSLELSRLQYEIQGYGQDQESIELEQLYLASGQSELRARCEYTGSDHRYNKISLTTAP